MLLSWWKGRRRRKLLARAVPAGWQELLETSPFFPSLSKPEQVRLRDLARIFIAEKDWEGCRGLEITDEIKVTIAGQACVLVLGLDIDLFRRVQTILVYPKGFRVPRQQVSGAEVLLEEETDLLGEAHYRGPVILSWEEIMEDVQYPQEGRNLVLHEFAHQLDMLNGQIDGTPPLADAELQQRWQQVMTAEYRRLGREASAGADTLLDPYGATDAGEFFAVATECFFTRPLELQERRPRLYEVLRDYFRQDPASRPHAW
jgi:Mlc titration factor MtfA (ptsG expression regulator)